MILCDTDVIIEYFKGNPDTVKIIQAITPEIICISSISIMELYFGAINKKEPNSPHYFLSASRSTSLRTFSISSSLIGIL
jgi:predicted nucleic acid-binding protein